MLMKRSSTKKMSLIFLALVMIAGILLPSMAFAQGNDLAMLTLNREAFTYIAEDLDDGYEITVSGLTNTYQPAPVDASKVTLESSNPDVTEITKLSDTPLKYKVKIIGVGDAVITASYADEGVASVPSNVFFDMNKSAADNVKVIVKYNGNDLYNSTVTVDPGLTQSYNNVLQNAPTALGALVKTGLNIEVFDGFVNSIDGIQGMMDGNRWVGWNYKVNGEKPAQGAGVYRLKSNDKVEFVYE